MIIIMIIIIITIIIIYKNRLLRWVMNIDHPSQPPHTREAHDGTGCMRQGLTVGPSVTAGPAVNPTQLG